jgi:hypothetical protein
LRGHDEIIPNGNSGIHQGNLMLRISRLRFGLSAMLIFVLGGLAGLGTGLTASSGKVPSLGDYIGAICATAFRSSPSAEQPFLSENVTAMTKMMVDMAIKPSGDVDRDFVDLMVPHHQGAIDMALAVLRYGRNAQIKRMAQEIIVTQQQEIATMRLAVGEPLPPPASSPTTVSSELPLDSASPR